MTQIRTAAIAIIVTLACITAEATHATSSSSATNHLTVSDVIGLESASQFDVSRNGSWAVWVKRSPNTAKNKRQTNIMLTSLKDTSTIQLTRGPQSDSSPKFSPGGSKIAFLGSRGKGKTQIYLLHINGGEPEKLTSAQDGVKNFDWLNDKKILFTAREDSTWREKKLKRAKDDVIVVADQEHFAPIRLFSIDLQSKKTERLTTNPGQISEFAISPDGVWVVTNESQDVNYEYDYRVPPKQFLLNLETGEKHEIFDAPHLNPYDFKWSNDSRGFFCRKAYASDSTDTYVSINHLYYYDISTARLSRVDRDWVKGLGYRYEVTKDGVIAALADGTTDRTVLYKKHNERFTGKVLASPSGKPMAVYAVSRYGNLIIYAVSNASSIPEVMSGVIKDGSIQGEHKIIKLNEKLKKKILSKTEVISWRGARGDRVEGILYYPLEYEKGTLYPLVCLIHGGPSGVDRDYFSERWSNYPHLLASRGTFVLKVNYHGSGNYGLEWMESIKGRYYDLEVPDILKGIDYLIKKKLVDRNRLGIMGWSNGSILAIECCLRSDRFKALCAGAGDVNWTSDYGNCAFGAAFDNAYLGGPPWEHPRTYVSKSPLFRMKKMKTPTLIMFGTKDTNVPTEQGWQHFRAMQQIGKAPVRFLLFPGTGHGLRKLSHQRRKMEEELAWFNQYLFKKYEEKNEALNDDSPLAMELKKTKAKKSGNLYGIPSNGVLMPEVVASGKIKAGRFEITRAQFHEFSPGYSYAPGTGNYPANGISFDQADAYCRWLSGKTGRQFRLPTADEMKKLMEKADLKNENNLEWWAGYEPTPDERKMLEEKIRELEKTTLLLKEVGSFKPAGKEGIYDLGGNVAEWVTNKSGEGEIMGLSAISTRDKRTAYKPPSLEYVGFRVCEDSPDE